MKYFAPEAEIILVDTLDVILASNGNGGVQEGGNGEIILPDTGEEW